MIGTIKLFEGYSGKNRKVSPKKAIVFTQNLATVTYAHHSLIQGNRKGTINGLIFTIILALIFTSLQGFEYYTAPFTISDGALDLHFILLLVSMGITYAPIYLLKQIRVRRILSPK